MNGDKFMKSLLEAAVFGLITVVVGYAISFLLSGVKLIPEDLPEDCEEWNKNYAMEISLFLTGVGVYYLGYPTLELIGMKKKEKTEE